MLEVNNSLVLVIDIQQKLTKMLKEDVCTDIEQKSHKLVKAAKILGVKTVVTEQYPKGLGLTIDGIRDVLEQDYKPIEKTCFSALSEEGFEQMIAQSGKKQIVLCGIESHICVYQSAMALLDKGYEVIIAKDICASRNKFEYKTAMDLLKSQGAKISCLEIILFEWLKGAKNPVFKEVQALIK